VRSARNQEDSLAETQRDGSRRLPKEVRDAIQFYFVEELSEVFMHALGKRIITPVLLGCRRGAAQQRRGASPEREQADAPRDAQAPRAVGPRRATLIGYL